MARRHAEGSYEHELWSYYDSELPFAHLWSRGLGLYQLRLFSWPTDTSGGHSWFVP